MSPRMYGCAVTAILAPWLSGLFVAAPCHAEDFPRLIPSPPSKWQVGDGWPLTVERSPPSGPAARYPMHVIVTGMREPQNQPHWELKFLIPTKGDIPPGVEESWRMLVRQTDGAIHLIGREGASSDDAVREVGEVRVVTAPPDGFPVELFFEPLDYEQDEFKNAGGALTLHRQADGQTLTVEATYGPAGGEAVRVRQQWVQGEKWWRDYERFRGGRRELHAWRDPPADFTPPHDKDAPPRPKEEEEDDAGLRGDPRLQTALTFEFPQPRLTDLTGRVEKATGVPLTLQEGLDRDSPRLGGQSFRDTPAWRVLRQTAALVGPDARWEKAETGYRLNGAWPPVPPKPLPPGGANWWLTGLSLIPLAGIFLLAWWLDRRARKAKAARGEP